MNSKQIVNKIERIRQKGFIPSEILDFVQDVFLKQLDFYHQRTIKSIESKEIESKLTTGKPLLLRRDFPIELKEIRDLLNALLKVVANYARLKEYLDILESDLKDDEFVAQSIKKFLEGDDAFFRIYGEKLENSPRLLSFLIQSSILPFVASYSKGFDELISLKEYPFGHCPICGSLPLISVLKDKSGKRKNFCSFCLFEYPVERTKCVFCGEPYKKEHFYFTTEDLPGYRVDICDKCKKYIKTIDFRDRDEQIIPMLDDLASLPLDIIAKKEGYLRPTLSFWGF